MQTPDLDSRSIYFSLKLSFSLLVFLAYIIRPLGLDNLFLIFKCLIFQFCTAAGC